MSNDVDIRIREDGSVVVIRNFDALITASDKAGTAITGLKTTLETLKTVSLKILIDEVKLLATELKTLNSGSTELTALKNAMTALSGSGTGLTRLQTILQGFSNSVTGLGQLHNALQQLNTSGNNFDRLNSHLAALPPLIAHVTALHTALSALVALNPQIAILAAEVRNLAGSTTAIRQFQQSIVALNASMANLVRQSQQIAAALQNLNGAARNSSSAFFGLSNTLAGLSLYIVAQKVRDWIDAWASVSGLIHIATESFAEFTLVQEKLFAVTQNIRSPLEETAQLYARINRVSDSLGASQNQSIKFTEGVGKALAIQHSRVGEVTGGLIQLAQALGSGIVRSQEFRSINDSLPVVMRTVAKNMEGGAVSVSQLRRRMLEGNLTSEQFFQAFLRGSATLDKDFKESGYTISQAFSILNNDMIKFIGQLNKASGFSDAFAASLRFLGSNIEILVGIAIFALITWLGGLTIAFVASTTALGVMTSALTLFYNVVLKNPTVFLIASLTTLAFTMYTVKDSIDLGTSSLVKFGGKTTEVRATFGDFLKLLLQDTKDYLGAVWTAYADLFSGINEVTKDNAKGGSKGLFDFDATGIIAKILTVARIFDLAASTIRGVSAMLANILEFLFGNIGIAIDTVADKFNQFMNKFKKEQTAPLVIPIAMTTEQLAQNIRTDKDQIMKDMVDPQGNSLTAGINRQAELAQKDAVARKLALQKAALDMDKRGTPDPVKKKEDGKKTLQSAYEALLGSINKVEAAYYEEAKAQKTLNDAAAAGLLNSRAKQLGVSVDTLKLRLLADITAKYEDQKFPLAAVNRELDKELEVLKMLPEQRAVSVELDKLQLSLKEKGKTLDAAELEALRQKILLKTQESKVGAIRDQVMGDYRSKQTDPLNTEQAYTDLLKDPNAKDPKKAILDNEMTKNPDMFAGTQEAIDAQITAIEMMYSRIDFLRKNDIISEETAKFQRTKIKQQEQQILNKTTEDTFSNLAVLSKSGNRKLAVIGKAAAITMATIKGFEAIQLALATPPGWPYNAPNVASVTIAQAANLASIAGVGFMTGGSFDVAGSGGHDSQTVAFRASPGERVSIQTPQQYRKGDPNSNSSQGQQKPADNNIRIVNVLDPALVGNYLSTREGERLVLNVIEKNSSSVRNFVRES
jgi:tape measure domain-containing protein